MRHGTLAVLTLLIFSALGSLSFGGDTESERKSLKGLSGIEVEVYLDDPKVAEALKGKIQTDVELRLRKAGVRVVEHSAIPEGQPSLQITINLLADDGAPKYVFVSSVRLRQFVVTSADFDRPVSQRNYLKVVTWGVESLGTVGRSKIETIRDTVNDEVDMFINAYLSQNPKN